MYLLQAWFSLSGEGVEDAVCDSYAMRRFLGLDFTVEQVPDATTLLHFRHLLEKHDLVRKLLETQGVIFEGQAGSCTGAASWTRRSSPRRYGPPAWALLTRTPSARKAVPSLIPLHSPVATRPTDAELRRTS